MEGAAGGLFIIIFIVIVFSAYSYAKNRGIVHLALSKFTIDPEAEDQIIIEGRKTGLIQWLLVKFKLGNIYQIKIKKDHITYSEDSAAGKTLALVPIHKVSSTSCGYQKPIGLVIFAVILALISLICLFGGEFVAFIICLLIAALFVFLYIYLKNFFIAIETIGSTRLGFSFKRSYIENVPIDIEKIESAIAMINQMVIKNK